MMKSKPLPPADVLRECFTYDRETGNLYWNARKDAPPKWNGRWAGKLAGNADYRGRISINVTGWGLLRAHRIIWKLENGEDPSGEIDHIDGNPSNNRISNLRIATREQNMRNTPGHSASGYKGVSMHKLSGLWRARVRVNSKEVCRYFETPEAAYAGYCDLAKTHYGEFARVA